MYIASNEDKAALARTLFYYANALYDTEDYKEAEINYKRSLKLRTELYGEENYYVANVLNNYG